MHHMNSSMKFVSEKIRYMDDKICSRFASGGLKLLSYSCKFLIVSMYCNFIQVYIRILLGHE